ncbi:type II toxin-antitoxin system VapC family toxin [Baekduia sp.]|uniref:type II toxin-antitoxin system VapC family toxin n=1 Tax=Baekduia sp. TaxID=2600305 RepID=UPI002DF95B69|nr:type II toxin-antitoxin system VapC family toxin [Baekduia sp.]
MIVIDASVLTDFLLGRDKATEAIDRELAGREHDPLHAPEVVEPETLNALRSLVRARAVTDQRADEAVDDLGVIRLIRYPHDPLRARIWELRHNLTAYDAAYLALTEALDGAVLMTGDPGLATSARAALGDDRVRHVS